MAFLAGIRSRLAATFAAARPVVAGSGGWYPLVVRESYTGAWQENVEIRCENLLANPIVFRCVTLIATDIGKLALRLVAIDDDGIWHETTSPAFSPVLRVPNRYQTLPLFLESWVLAKLLYGNTYVLKDRDARGVVTALYVLDPAKTQALVAPDGSVYYKLSPTDLAGVPPEGLAVPAREVIHDRFNCLWHPLVGVTPLYACAGAARQGLEIQATSTAFFTNGGRPSGMMTPPAGITIDQKTLDRLTATWHSLGPGKTAFLGNALNYAAVGATAVDSALVEQLGWTAKAICGCFGVPISMVDSSQQPPYANSEASLLQYHSQCLQTHLLGIETALDAGLELPAPYGTEFDLDDLIWMDTPTKTKAAHDSISAGAVSPNEARRKYFGLGPVPGGASPYLQQQMFSLEALAARDAADPFATPAPAPAAAPAAPLEPTDEVVAAAVGDLAES